AKDALVRGAGDCEHPADERRDDDARRAQLPEDRVLDVPERRVDVEQGHVRERGDDDRAGRDADRADAEPDEERRDEEHDRAESPGGRDAARPYAHLDRLCDHERFATLATTRAKSTMRGPQRDATLSSTVTTLPLRTAATFCQPGRSPTVPAV